jgi:putative ABC transport system permease protein
MRFDTDRFREIGNTLTRNKSRSFLTGFGIFWGIFMLLALIGSGQGLKDLLGRNFEGFASNAGLIISRPTSKPYKGFKRDRDWSMTTDDISILRNNIPEIDVATPLNSKWGKTIIRDEYKIEASIKGLRPEYAMIESPHMKYGRYLNEMDILQNKKVCVLGKKIYKTLFPEGGDPCGNFVRFDGLYYEVVGVDYSSGNMSVNGRADMAVSIPLSLFRKTYNSGNKVDIICITAKSGIRVSEILDKAKKVLAKQHYFDPGDSNACMVLNTESFFMIVNSLFKGVNILVFLVGLGTLFAGAIGVSNIMMVTVKERTVEIGIRRAIGATPKMILSQIVSESIVLTMIAGAIGIVFSVAILSMAELAATNDGTLTAHFQIGFWTAIVAVLILTALGVLAGMAPAARAMKIKPVDAMRDE